MVIVRNPGPWSFGIIAAGCALVGFLFYVGSPDAVKLAGALGTVIVAGLGARSGLQKADKVKLADGRVVEAYRPPSNTLGELEELEPQDVDVSTFSGMASTKKGQGGFVLRGPVLALAALGLALLTIQGCGLFTKQNARTVLDVARVACIIARATLPDASVQQACDVSDELAPAMRDILGEQRAAMRRFAAEHYGACGGASDAGTDAR